MSNIDPIVVVPVLCVGFVVLIVLLVVVVPVGIAGIYVGVRLQKRIEPRTFYRVVHTLLFLTGAKLLYDGLSNL